MKKRYYKIRYGYDSGSYVVVEEGVSLEKAIYARISQTPVVLGGRMVEGKFMIIEPYYHQHTGWNPNYNPQTSEDFSQIKRDCPDYDGILEKYVDRVQQCIKNNTIHLIGTGQLSLNQNNHAKIQPSTNNNK